jgi:glucose/arabinose dehydrogenase
VIMISPMKPLGLILPLLVLASCLFAAANAAAAAVTLPPGFQAEPILETKELGLEATNFKFAPDGRIFVATKGGKILVYPAGAHRASEATVFANLAKQTFDWGDHGVLGLALDPKFDEGRPYVYALYSFNHELGKPPTEDMPEFPSSGSGTTKYEGDECREENKCVVSGRLVRLTAELGDHAKVEPDGEAEEKVLLEGWCQQSSSHSIGDLSFGPEGALYVSGGEGAIYTDTDYGQYENLCGDPPGANAKGSPLTVPDAEGGSLRSQSLLRPDGEVLLNGTLDRIDPDTGEGWPNNPDASSTNANARRIVGFGFRNPFRFVVNPRLGDIFLGNVGANLWEEIDRIPIEHFQVGKPIYNSGWPCYEGPEPEKEFSVLGLGACDRLYDTPGATEKPFFYYSHFEPVVPGDECSHNAGSAISGEAFYEGSTYPAEYDNALFFSDSVRGCIYVMLADADGEPDPATVRPFLSSEVSDYPGVDVEQGPEGSIYYTTLDDGTINRVVYDPEAVTARLDTKGGNPWGNVPLKVDLDASGSTVPAGHTAKYEWDLDGGGEFNDGSDSPEQEVEFTDPTKNVSVAVRVEDEQTGKTSTAKLTVYPGDSPPKLTIVDPEPTLTWGVGQTIHFEGYANSEEEGHEGADMPAEDSYWKVRLLHCPFEASSCHEHPIQVFPGVARGTINAPDHSYPSFVNFIFSATDSRGLSAETSLKVEARPVPLQIHSEPPGIDIGVGETHLVTPAEYKAIEGSPTTVAAPEEAVLGGIKYAFEGWSDGGGRVHEVSSTETGTYTARYRVVETPLVPIQIHSEPPGIDIGVGETHLVTPAEYKAIEGSPTTVAAPAEATVDGVRYVFQHWSDGGQRVHEVPSTAPGTYTAIYAAVEESSGGGGGGDTGGGGETGGGNSSGGDNSGGGGNSSGGGPSGGGAPGGGGSGPESKGSVPPPKPKLKRGPAKQTRSTTAKFVFGGSAGAKFMCKLDGGKFAVCRSPKVYKGLKPGRHKVSIYATDGSGGRSGTTVFNWKIVPAG